MKAVCPNCKIELRPEECGVTVVMMATYGPMEARAADLWRCPCCGAEVIFQFADKPLTVGEKDTRAFLAVKGPVTARRIAFWLNSRERDMTSSDVITSLGMWGVEYTQLHKGEQQ